MPKAVKESIDEKQIRGFINFMCEGDLANANMKLDLAVKEKIKTLIRKNLQQKETA